MSNFVKIKNAKGLLLLFNYIKLICITLSRAHTKDQNNIQLINVLIAIESVIIQELLFKYQILIITEYVFHTTSETILITQLMDLSMICICASFTSLVKNHI